MEFCNLTDLSTPLLFISAFNYGIIISMTVSGCEVIINFMTTKVGPHAEMIEIIIFILAPGCS